MPRSLQKNTTGNDKPAGADDAAATTSKPKKNKAVTPQIASERQSRQRAIGIELRRMFDDIAKEPVPQEFLDLLRQIDEKPDS